VAHHGDQHVDENDDDGDVVEREQERPDAFDDRRGRVAAREARRVLAAVLLRRVLDLDTVHWHQTEHGPEQIEQRPRQPNTHDNLPHTHASLDMINKKWDIQPISINSHTRKFVNVLFTFFVFRSGYVY